MSRPEVLFPLYASLETLDGIGPKSAQALEGLGVRRPKDLLFLLPYAGTDRRRRDTVQGAAFPTTVTVEVTVGQHLPPRRKGGPYRINVRDALLEWSVVFFHAKGDYLQKLLPTGQRRVLSGKVETFDGVAQMVHPDHVLRVEEAGTLPPYEPVYPLTAGVTLKQVQKAVHSALARTPELPEWIDPALKAREGWPDWHAALTAAHAPDDATALVATHPARARLAYDEFFAHQLTLSLARQSMRRAKGMVSAGSGVLQGKVLKSLPYAPTSAQTRAIREIAADMASP